MGTIRIYIHRPPDGAVPDNAVDRIIVLYNPNTNTDDVFYFDNFEKYCTDDRGICLPDPEPNPIQMVPTMTQWGLFLFGLIMLNLGLVFIYRRREVLNYE